MASSLIFPKTCETCCALLPAADKLGVCHACSSKILKISAPFCPGCGRTSAYENTRCGHCGQEAFGFDRAYAVCYYEGKMQELLQAFKFGERKTLKVLFVKFLSEFISKYLSRQTFDALVSVPMDKAKLRERGFNQARLLSAALAQELGLPDLSAFLRKNKTSAAQSLLKKTQRARNIAGTFYISEPGAFSDKNILLIDDILTTGFTASECARVLKQDKALSVTVLAAARGL